MLHPKCLLIPKSNSPALGRRCTSLRHLRNTQTNAEGSSKATHVQPTLGSVRTLPMLRAAVASARQCFLPLFLITMVGDGLLWLSHRIAHFVTNVAAIFLDVAHPDAIANIFFLATQGAAADSATYQLLGVLFFALVAFPVGMYIKAVATSTLIFTLEGGTAAADAADAVPSAAELAERAATEERVAAILTSTEEEREALRKQSAAGGEENSEEEADTKVVVNEEVPKVGLVKRIREAAKITLSLWGPKVKPNLGRVFRVEVISTLRLVPYQVLSAPLVTLWWTAKHMVPLILALPVALLEGKGFDESWARGKVLSQGKHWAIGFALVTPVIFGRTLEFASSVGVGSMAGWCIQRGLADIPLFLYALGWFVQMCAKVTSDIMPYTVYRAATASPSSSSS